MTNPDDLTPDIAPVLQTQTGLSMKEFSNMSVKSRHRILGVLEVYLDDLGAHDPPANFREPLRTTVNEERFDPLAFHFLDSRTSHVTTHLKQSPSEQFTRDVALSVLKTLLVHFDAPIHWSDKSSATVQIQEITLPNTECALSAQGTFTFCTSTDRRPVVHDFSINLVRSDHPTDLSWKVSKPD